MRPHPKFNLPYNDKCCIQSVYCDNGLFGCIILSGDILMVWSIIIKYILVQYKEKGGTFSYSWKSLIICSYRIQSKIYLEICHLCHLQQCFLEWAKWEEISDYKKCNMPSSASDTMAYEHSFSLVVPGNTCVPQCLNLQRVHPEIS